MATMPDFQVTLLPDYTSAAEMTLDFYVGAAPLQIGAGAQAKVLNVTDAAGNHFALKLFKSRSAAQTEWAALSFHKASKVVPEAYFYGSVSQAPAPYADCMWAIVMELISGPTLAKALAGRAAAGGLEGAGAGAGEGAAAASAAGVRGAFTYEQAVDLMSGVIDFCAMNDAQKSRLPRVHRDLKPDNLIIDATTHKLRVVDFGISADAPDAARTQASMGTRLYSAPELFCPEKALGTFDPASPKVDTYSLGAILAAMLFGEGAVPDYGNPFAAPASIKHDAALAAQTAARVRESIAETYGRQIAPTLAQSAVEAAFGVIDARVLACISACLSCAQSQRPHPSQLASMIPLDACALENEVFLIASVTSLGGGARFGGPLSLEDEIQADRDVLFAIDEFNCGRYNKAAQVFEKRARTDAFATSKREGVVSCTYYLGVMIRDKYTPELAEKFSLSDVAYLFGQAAAAGNVLAQNALGQMLHKGFAAEDGTLIQDAQSGLTWIQRAAQDVPEQGKVGFRFAKEYLASLERDK